MAMFENFKKIVQNVTDTTVKKTGEQVQITKLSLEKSNLEKEIDALYTKIGRHCYTLSKAGETFDDAIGASIAEVDALAAQIAQLESRISAHKAERDGAQYQLHFENEAEPEIEVDVYTTEDLPADEAAEAVEETAEAAQDAVEEAVGDALEAAQDAAEAVVDKAGEIAETVADKAEEVVEEVREAAEDTFRPEE